MQKGEKNIRHHLCNTYNAAILACGVLGEEAKALSYFRRMKSHDVPRNEATYKALLNLSSLMGDENTEEIRRLAIADGIVVY
jgi:pentatricopeptide repeat protein